MAGLTRGSLPPGVYWRRRLFVLGLAAGVVLLVGGLVRGVSGPDPDEGVAQQAAAEASESAAPPSAGPSDEAIDPSQGTDESEKPDESKKPEKSESRSPLPEPRGECSPADIVAEPRVGESVAGRDVAMLLKLQTQLSDACTFDLSAKTLTVKITSGSDEIWASRHCPEAIPEKTLVLRQEPVKRVRLTWNAKRSDEGCTRLTQWALPGWYHVASAALGGEPSTAKFELETPRAPEEPDPKQEKQSDKQPDKQRESGSERDTKPKKKADEDLHRTER